MIDTALAAYRQDLAIKGYSPKTQATYLGRVRNFLAATGKPASSLAKDAIKSHLFRIIDSGKCSFSATWAEEVLSDVTGIDAYRCPACGQGRLVESLFPAGNGERAPPAEASA